MISWIQHLGEFFIWQLQERTSYLFVWSACWQLQLLPMQFRDFQELLQEFLLRHPAAYGLEID